METSFKPVILLINPYISSRERYGKDIGEIGGHQMPLGIFYLASFLRKHGYEASIMDAEAESLGDEDILQEISRRAPKIVGISSTTVAFYNAKKLCQRIHIEFPDILIVLGGPHITANQQQALKGGFFHYGIIKEGEIPFLRLVRFLLEGKGHLSEIPNLVYFSQQKMQLNPGRIFVENLDEIPPPLRSLVKNIDLYRPPIGAYRRTPVASVITSRGCPYECIFCDNNTFGRKVRFFSAEYVAAEIQDLIENAGIQEIAFLDDTFILNKGRLQNIFQILQEKNISFPWTCMTRVDNLDYETLLFMKANGCWQIRIGIESGNQEVIDFIKKGISLEHVKRVCRWCRKLGIHVSGFFMLGHHIDTIQTMQETIDFGLSLPLTDIIVTLNTPIPGTLSYDLAPAYGSLDESNLQAFNYWETPFIPKGLTREILLQMQLTFLWKFYFRWATLKKQIRKIESKEVAWKLVVNGFNGAANFLKNYVNSLWAQAA